MTDDNAVSDAEGHSHVFLGVAHERNERKTWIVIGLCTVMMLVEIVGGGLFGSLALIADGLHMSTHAAALLIAALAYTYARRRASDPRFAFGTGKFGDLAAFTSAIVLAMIALLIGYEAAARLIQPVRIDFDQAIPIAVIGLLVNIASAWLLGNGDVHEHEHTHEHAHHDQKAHAAAHRDHNIRAAFVHVAADAAVSVLAIVGLSAGRLFGWIWMDPIMGLIGAIVIGSWSYGLVRAAGGILLDMTPDDHLASELRRIVESEGDRLIDLHLWRLGPGHYGTIMSIVTEQGRGPNFYRTRLSRFPNLSHVTIEVCCPSQSA